MSTQAGSVVVTPCSCVHAKKPRTATVFRAMLLFAWFFDDSDIHMRRSSMVTSLRSLHPSRSKASRHSSTSPRYAFRVFSLNPRLAFRYVSNASTLLSNSMPISLSRAQQQARIHEFPSIMCPFSDRNRIPAQLGRRPTMLSSSVRSANPSIIVYSKGRLCRFQTKFQQVHALWCAPAKVSTQRTSA